MNTITHCLFTQAWLIPLTREFDCPPKTQLFLNAYSIFVASTDQLTLHDRIPDHYLVVNYQTHTNSAHLLLKKMKRTQTAQITNKHKHYQSYTRLNTLS